jgi:hypothetical protein
MWNRPEGLKRKIEEEEEEKEEKEINKLGVVINPAAARSIVDV